MQKNFNVSLSNGDTLKIKSTIEAQLDAILDNKIEADLMTLDNNDLLINNKADINAIIATILTAQKSQRATVEFLVIEKDYPLTGEEQEFSLSGKNYTPLTIKERDRLQLEKIRSKLLGTLA